MIGIKQYGNKWRFGIDNEMWEFEKRADMEKVLKAVLDLKEKHGKVRQE